MGRGGIYAMESLSGTYALVVDGDRERRSLLSGILRYCGALVTAVETPRDALFVMHLLKPPVLIVDFSGAYEPGLEFIRRVRALKPEEGGMVAAVAVVEAAADGALARSRGFDAFVAKPIDPWELCRVVTTLLAT